MPVKEVVTLRQDFVQRALALSHVSFRTPYAALDREDAILDRMTQNLTPEEREAFKILSPVIYNGFGR